jgi:hypothetical protein
MRLFVLGAVAAGVLLSLDLSEGERRHGSLSSGPLVGLGSDLPSGPPAGPVPFPSTVSPVPLVGELTSTSTESPPAIPDEAFNQVLRQVCTTCHNDVLNTGNISLQGFDVSNAATDLDRAEAVINKLRLEMMPPPGIPRPGGDTLMALAETLETRLDQAAQGPNPGTRIFQRLNRAEYSRTIADLLSLEVDAGNWLPLDNHLGNFDNMADAQVLSPTLLDAYLTAAGTISRMAVGDRDAPRTQRTYQVPPGVSQHAWERIEGAPFGTRGGVVVVHHFPSNGEYVFEVETRAGSQSIFEEIDISIDGHQVAQLPFEPGVASGNRGGGYTLRTEPIFVEAGQHRVSAAFIRTAEGPYEDILRPHDWSLAGERGKQRVRGHEPAPPMDLDHRRAFLPSRIGRDAEPGSDLHLSARYAGRSRRVCGIDPPKTRLPGVPASRHRERHAGTHGILP